MRFFELLDTFSRTLVVGHLTGKTMTALRYSLVKYADVADWFLKSDDDT